MSEIQSHPWFLQCLPAGAVHMNALILADNASRPTQLRQPPEAIAAMVRVSHTGIIMFIESAGMSVVIVI